MLLLGVDALNKRLSRAPPHTADKEPKAQRGHTTESNHRDQTWELDLSRGLSQSPFTTPEALSPYTNLPPEAALQLFLSLPTSPSRCPHLAWEGSFASFSSPHSPRSDFSFYKDIGKEIHHPPLGSHSAMPLPLPASTTGWVYHASWG